MSILDEIFAWKRKEVAERKQRYPFAEVQRAAEMAPAPLDIVAALRSRNRRDLPALIAEVKKASPSRGVLRADFDPICLAQQYIAHGAAAISVLTDEKYFQGHLEVLRQIAALAPRPPLLRKDFLCDEYQIYEARAAGADAVLLIVAGLEQDALLRLHTLAQALGMTPLVEVHTLDELHRALECNPLLIGINNRNLHDFSVHLETTFSLRPHIPDPICVVAESGIHGADEAYALAAAGVDAILVGEALVTAKDVAAKVREFCGGE
jgi:indole-3-glycerol phosphate synthase